MTTFEYAKRVVEEYDLANYGRKSLTNDGVRWRLELATGGWSENEEFLENLASFNGNRHSGWMWWCRCWVSTHRGGLFIFEGKCSDPLLPHSVEDP